MKLIGELKEKVSKAESIEQAKEIIEEAGMELNDKELDEVAGGGLDFGLIWQNMGAEGQPGIQPGIQPNSVNIGSRGCFSPHI